MVSSILRISLRPFLFRCTALRDATLAVAGPDDLCNLQCAACKRDIFDRRAQFSPSRASVHGPLWRPLIRVRPIKLQRQSLQNLHRLRKKFQFQPHTGECLNQPILLDVNQFVCCQRQALLRDFLAHQNRDLP